MRKMESPEEEAPAVRLEDYAHSPAHYYVIKNDLPRLTRLLAALPRLSPADHIHTSGDALRQEGLADQISAAIDRRDVPRRETPLHLAVGLHRTSAAAALTSAGADPSLQNSSGWTPLQESILLRRSKQLSLLLLRHHHLSAWHKWRRRLPRLISALRGLRDFYLEISFHFESSVVPFLPRVAPSDTYRIWKRGGSLRADTSLAGFDGLKVRRADQSFLFLGGDEDDRPQSTTLGPGSLLVLNHSRKEISDAFEGARSLMTPEEEDEFLSDAAAHRPGLDITGAELVGRTNWRRKEKTEMVGEWKARVYEVHNVVFSFKTRKAVDPVEPLVPSMVDLDLDEDDDGFLVAEIPDMPLPHRHSCYEQRGHFGKGNKEGEENWGGAVEMRRRSVDVPSEQFTEGWAARRRHGGGGKAGGKEKETVKSLRPWVWLTEEFPLKTAEVLPLLDVLASKVKAVRRLRELLTAKFPPGTFPVKVAIPVVPTVRVIVTFTKFVELPPQEQFFTPLSSPRDFCTPEDDEHHKTEAQNSWPEWSSNLSSSTKSLNRSKSVSPSPPAIELTADPFAIPSDYTWTSINAKTQKKETSKPKKEPKDSSTSRSDSAWTTISLKNQKLEKSKSRKAR